MTSLKPYLTQKNIIALEDTRITTIEDVLHLTETFKQSRFWIKGTATIKMSSAPFWYMGCTLCYISSCASTAGESFDCRYCNTPNVTALPRADIYIEDETGKLATPLMGEIAEEYLQCTTFKLMGISKGILHRLNDEVNIRLNIDDQYIFYVKAIALTQSPNDRGKTPVTFSHNSTHKFEVISLEEYVSSRFKHLTRQHMKNYSQQSRTLPIQAQQPIILLHHQKLSASYSQLITHHPQQRRN